MLFHEHVLKEDMLAQREVNPSSRLIQISTERGSKPLSGFFDGKEFAYGSLRNPRFSLRRSLFLTSAYGAYGGNVGSPK